MFTLSRDTTTISARIVAIKRHGEAFRQEQHSLAIDCLYHAAEHGNPILLNRFFNALGTENDRRALRNYIAKWSFEMLETLKDGEETVTRTFALDADNKRIPTDRHFLTYTRANGFDVINGRLENRKRFMEFSEKHLLNPTEDRWAPFWAGDNAKDERTLMMSDTKAVEQIKALVKRLFKPREGTVGHISEAFKTELAATVSRLEAVVELPGMKAPSDAQVTKAIADMGKRMIASAKAEEVTDEVSADAVIAVEAGRNGRGRSAAAN